MRTSSTSSVGTLCLCLLTAGCGNGGPHRGPIAVHQAASDQSGGSVLVPACGGEPSVQVTETPGEVHVVVQVTTTSGGSQLACAGSVRLALLAPLGKRLLIDDTSRQRIVVSSGQAGT